jgi:hypothetical protein
MRFPDADLAMQRRIPLIQILECNARGRDIAEYGIEKTRCIASAAVFRLSCAWCWRPAERDHGTSPCSVPGRYNSQQALHRSNLSVPRTAGFAARVAGYPDLFDRVPVRAWRRCRRISCRAHRFSTPEVGCRARRADGRGRPRHTPRTRPGMTFASCARRISGRQAQDHGFPPLRFGRSYRWRGAPCGARGKDGQYH